MSSHLTAGTSYKVVIRAECARVTVNLEYEGSPTEAICGGLRIKQTRVHDGISSANDVITDYAYTDKQYPSVSSGKLFRKPTYAFRVNTRTAVFTSMSQVPLFEVDGLHLGYDRVVVSQSGNGATEYKYNFPTRTQDYASYPVKPTTNELGVGELIGSTVFDDNGRTVASTTPTYRQDERESFGGGSAAGYFFVKRQGVPYYTGSLSYKNLYTPYWMTTGVRRPSTVTATVDGVSTTTEYTYHSLNLLPETVTTTNSNGDEHQQRFYFFDPTDLPFTDITQEEWEELNLKHLSYQTEQYHNGNLLDGSKTDYRFYKADGTSPSTSATDRLPVPWVYRQQHYERTYEASGSLRSGRWEIQSTVARYNAYGQIREQQTPHWPSTTVNYNGDLAISTTSSGQTTTYIYEGDDTTTPDDDTRRLEQVIAVDGTSTSYTYDDFGRVKTVTDDCRGIITTYTYSFRYNNENINFFQAEVAYPASGDNRSALTTTKTRKYTDGLGRPLQTVAIGSGASIQDDVVSGVSYDRYGRVSKTYEPLGQPNNQGAHISLATNLPGTVHTYESSPLNRLQTVTPAGLAYPTTYSYGTNIAEDGVLRDGTTTEYVAGSLRKHTVTDANGNHLITFTDKLGQQVLSRRLPAGGGASDRLDTYSVHDGKGRVRHVLPPGSTTNHTSLIYSYQYDGADQVTSKLVPGRGWTYYSYNNKHLLKGYRDERFKQAGHWYVYNYDSQGRIESEGLYKSNTLYWFLENPHISEPYITTRYGTELHEIDKVKTVRTKILNEADQWLTTTNHYTPCGLLDYQMGNNHLNISAQERTDYVYDGAGNILESTYGHRDYNQVLTNVTSEHHYDFAGRAHKSFFQVGSGARTQLNALAFNPTGQVKTKYQGGTGKSGTLAWLQKLDYTYLDDGTLQGINLDGLTGSTQGLPDFYDYDRNVHDPNPGMPSTADMDAKDLFYLELYRDRAPTTNSYNLPARYNGDITAVATQVRGRSQQIWGMTYDGYDRMRDARFYQRSNRTSTASYTSRYRATVNYDKRGNISRLDRRGMYVYPDYWKYKQIDKLVYNYVGTGTGQTNQLHHIAEGADDNLGYRERATNYAYDVNGNLSYDVQRNADIEYNHLNLPVKIAYRNGTVQRHEFTYDASGTLLTRRGYGQTGAEEHRLDYVGGIEYYNWELNTVQHEEGRVYFDDGNQRYDYVLSDHLGNARLMYSDLNGNGIPEVPSEIIEELHYYPFGMRMSGPWMASARGNQEEYVKYQYNGIERVGTYGLGLNIALYRTLDPITGRWWQVDPKAEHDMAGSPYSSMYNSPMVYTDPRGDIPLLPIVGAAVGGVLNLGSQALQGNVTSFGEGLGYFTTGAVSGLLATTGNIGAARATMVGGNKAIQIATGKWKPEDLTTGRGLLETGLSVAGDFGLPGLTNTIAKPLASGLASLGSSLFQTSVSGGGSVIKQVGAQTADDIAFSVSLSDDVVVSASKITKTTFAQRLFLSGRFGITSTRFGNVAANAQGTFNQAGGLFKAGWSTGQNSAGQWGYKFRIGLGTSSAKASIARYHFYAPKSFVPNSFANPAIQVKRSLFKLGLLP